MKALLASKIITDKAILRDKALLIDKDRLYDIVNPEAVPAAAEKITDYAHLTIMPGLIDSHIHGAIGKDTMDGNIASLAEIGNFLASQGTTMWMPTTVSAPLPQLKKAIANVGDYRDNFARQYPHSAKVMGVFIESNFINEGKKGAHPASCIQPLNKEIIKELLQAGPVRDIIIAPELKEAAAYTKWITSAFPVKVSLGHSAATYEEACHCMEAGADAAVHTYCAMNSLHHREPGLLGAAMLKDNIYAELIADGIHVSAPAMEILLRLKPADKVILVSDACQGTGLKDGNYMLGILPITVKNGVARIENGALAGSTTTLLKSVKLLITKLQTDPVTAVKMASLNPARRFGMEKDYGSITPGKFADFIIVDDTYQLQATWLNGQEIYRK